MAGGVLKPVEPSVMKIGDDESCLSDVETAGITIVSKKYDKEILGGADELFTSIKLPKPVKYVRKAWRGGEEGGFIAGEIPECLRRGSGYDLKVLIAYLAWKLLTIENSVQKR